MVTCKRRIGRPMNELHWFTISPSKSVSLCILVQKLLDNALHQKQVIKLHPIPTYKDLATKKLTISAHLLLSFCFLFWGELLCVEQLEVT